MQQARPTEKTRMNGSPYLFIKASADHIPLANNSVSLVIATPPIFGARHRPKTDYCTSDPEEYDLFIRRFLKEATRIVQPRRHILLVESRTQPRGSKGARPIIFHVLQKQMSHGHWTDQRIRSETFFTHFLDVQGFPWWAFSLRLYRSLIRRYSEPGDIVAHVFSGSGNGAIAALELARTPILIDLHYHRQISRRLRKKVPLIPP
jgi:DNA methylase